MNFWDIAILAAVAGIAVFTLIRRRRKKGRSCCSGACENCGMCGIGRES